MSSRFKWFRKFLAVALCLAALSLFGDLRDLSPEGREAAAVEYGNQRMQVPAFSADDLFRALAARP